MTTTSANAASPIELDVLVVGAGFSGLYLLHRLRSSGYRVRVMEAGGDVGGTWYWNRYPGARCDVESMDYSYSFDDGLQQEWEWTERFPTQPEILRYLNHVADRFNLRPDIQFDTRVVAAAFDEIAGRWRVVTDRGDVFDSQFVVMASGCLSNAKLPEIPGLDTFRGNLYHTGTWPKDGVDFTGYRVGVIGTGSSGTQAIPLIAQQAAELTVLQRTPSFVMPARNAPLDPQFVADIKGRYPAYREQARQTPGGHMRKLNDESAIEAPENERLARYEALWQVGGPDILGAYGDLLRNQDSNDTLAEFLRSKIRQIVTDPVVAENLIPRGYPVGAKRMCIGTDYYETFNRSNVKLLNLREDPIVEIVPTGVRTESGVHEFDSLVMATGYDAITGAILAVDIRGRGGAPLADAWAAGPRTYLGVTVAGFPNLFLVTGPGSPSVLSNVVVSIEQHVEWICDHLDYLRDNGLRITEAEIGAQEEWVEHVNQVASRTLYNKGNSWYLGANVPGKPRIFMPYAGGVGAYRRHATDIAQQKYPGLVTA